MEGRLSLRRYLSSRLLWLILPIVLAVMALHWHIESSMLHELFTKSLHDKATTLATLVTRHDGRLEFEFADEYMPEYSGGPDAYVFQIWLPDGTPIERSRSVAEDLPRNHGPLDEPRTFTHSLADGRELRCLGIEFPLRLGTPAGAETAPSVILVVGARSEVLDRVLWKGFLKVAATGVVSIVGIALVVFLCLRRGVRLLERIADRVRSLAPSSVTRDLDELAAPVEIRPIVRSLNDSLRAIRGFAQREHRFHGAVAHELRTPIAELRAAADVALLWPNDESAKKLAVDARAIAVQMGGVVESLLELSQLEAEGPEAVPERFDLAHRVRLQVDEAIRRDGARRDVRVDVQNGFEVTSHPELWDVCLRNLLDNAMSYSHAEAAIEVRLEPEGGGARIRVSNPTEDFEEGTLEHCTERLWRGRRSRNDGSHFGLGLSIVAAACMRLGHRLEVDHRDGCFHAVIRPSAPDQNSQA